MNSQEFSTTSAVDYPAAIQRWLAWKEREKDSGQSTMDGEESGCYSQMDEVSLSKRAKMDGSESDRLLNFATAADEFELSLKRQKIPRDPMSHRIIEKRRRDRMNNCLADLSRLIPASYHKQGQGRIEKTEIIEMAIKHINLLQQRVDELEKKALNQEEGKPQAVTVVAPSSQSQRSPDCSSTKFYLGFKEAQDEVMRFLVEVESINTMDPFCKKIMKHLENASQKFVLKEHGVEKTELPPMDADCSSQPGMYSHSAFYQPSRGDGAPVSDDGTASTDVKNRDEHLRYLLGEQPSSMVGKVVTGSGNETGEERRGSVPMFSYSGHLSGVSSVVGSSGYISDASNMEKNSPNGSTSSRENVYKFKHNITKRFSQEGHRHHHHHRYNHHHHHHHRMQNHQTSDTSSNTSSRDLEDDQGQLRWKSNSKHHKSSGCSSVYTDDMGTENNSPNSDECNSGSNSTSASTSNRSHRGYNNNKNGQNGGHSSPECHMSLSSNTPSSCTSSVALPGFILHPTGTHYMPISVHNNNISNLFETGAEQDGMPVFHPISIPVHFRRPVISMPNITICSHLSSNSKQKDRCIKD